MAAAVVLDPAEFRGLNDSKKPDLPRVRSSTRRYVQPQVAVFMRRVDRPRQYPAGLLWRSPALKALPERPKLVFVDGNIKIDCGCDCEAVVSGDALSCCGGGL